MRSYFRSRSCFYKILFWLWLLRTGYIFSFILCWLVRVFTVTLELDKHNNIEQKYYWEVFCEMPLSVRLSGSLNWIPQTFASCGAPLRYLKWRCVLWNAFVCSATVPVFWASGPPRIFGTHLTWRIKGCANFSEVHTDYFQPTSGRSYRCYRSQRPFWIFPLALTPEGSLQICAILGEGERVKSDGTCRFRWALICPNRFTALSSLPCVCVCVCVCVCCGGAQNTGLTTEV